MTENEIIKALECCVTNGECNKCPMSLIRNCMNNLMRNTFVLITRKKAEIERLAARFNDYPVKTLIDNNNMMCSKSSEDYDKWFFNVSYQTIKEFADRLKDEMRLEDDCRYDCMNCLYECKGYVPIIDKLVKEMTEVSENE